jgi:hypothetical protein
LAEAKTGQPVAKGNKESEKTGGDCRTRLPHMCMLVKLPHAVTGDHRQLFSKTLGYDHPVKGIPMVKGKIDYLEQVRFLDGQNRKAFGPDVPR